MVVIFTVTVVMVMVLTLRIVVMVTVPVIVAFAIGLVLLDVVAFLITPANHRVLEVLGTVGVVVSRIEGPLVQQRIALVDARLELVGDGVGDAREFQFGIIHAVLSVSLDNSPDCCGVPVVLPIDRAISGDAAGRAYIVSLWQRVSVT